MKTLLLWLLPVRKIRGKTDSMGEGAGLSLAYLAGVVGGMVPLNLPLRLVVLAYEASLAWALSRTRMEEVVAAKSRKLVDIVLRDHAGAMLFTGLESLYGDLASEGLYVAVRPGDIQFYLVRLGKGVKGVHYSRSISRGQLHGMSAAAQGEWLKKFAGDWRRYALKMARV